MLQEANGAYRKIMVNPQPTGFGAEIGGLDLAQPLPAPVLAEVKSAWARHGVVAFPNQPLSLDALEAFTLQMGAFGTDPFIKPMPGHPNVLELRREPDEKATNFGAGWHSDWSFQDQPPAATILRSEVTPPVGGDTLFCDCARAYEALSPTMRSMLSPLRAIHSRRGPMAPRAPSPRRRRPGPCRSSPPRRPRRPTPIRWCAPTR